MSHSTHPPPAVNNPSIAVEINAATRKLHTELNKLIIERLPLALPPQTQSPARYAIGLSRFAATFFAFEEAFRAIRDDAPGGRSATPHDEEVRAWVATLLPRGLERSARLRSDLAHLQHATHARIQPTAVATERSSLIALAQSKPHILVAYAWIMYMAIFSGGRWIRQQLDSAGNTFWTGEMSKASADLPGFTFLRFDDDKDGEELKTAFKKRLSEADDLLTAEERQDIVNTGQELFQHCVNMIGTIDRDVWWQESTANWPLAIAVLGLGLIWLIWHTFGGINLTNR